MENITSNEWSDTIQLSSAKKKSNALDIYPRFSNVTLYIEDFNSVLQTIPPDNFLTLLSENFMGLTIDEDSTFQDTVISNTENLTMGKLLMATANMNLSLHFHNGKIKYSKDNIESIASVPMVIFRGNSIQVAVDGDAYLAEEAIKRITMFMYEQASIKRTWPEIEKFIFAKDWKVGVEVDLKLSTTDLLHPKLKDLLVSDNSPLKSFGSAFFDKKSRPIVHEKKVYIEPVLNVKINILDTVSGVIEQSTLSFDREKSFQRGTTTMMIVANCDIQTLEKTLNEIANSLRNG